MAAFFNFQDLFFVVGRLEDAVFEQRLIEESTQLAARIFSLAPYGFRPYIGLQNCRLVPAKYGLSYGLGINQFEDDAIVVRSPELRFNAEYMLRVVIQH